MIRCCRIPGLVWLLAVLGALTCQTFGADSVSSVTILTYSGTAEVSRREGVWDPAHTNQVLLVGDRMRTGTKSRATIRLSDGTTMTVGAEASFAVPEGRKRVTLNPLKGLFYFFHRDRPGEFELRSKTAAAAVRGTEFELEADEDGTWLLNVLEGDVLLETAEGELGLKTGEAALAKPGLKPQPVVMRQATDVIQWVFYYPAVLDVGELVLSAEEQASLNESLMAYRAGDLATALARCPFEQSARSDLEAIYRAALLLSVGEVAEAQKLLSGLSLNGEHGARARSLKVALEELIAVVKGSGTGVPPVRSGKPGSETHGRDARATTASEWLGESYRRQAESKLAEALAAAREAVGLSPEFGLGWERVAELEFSFGRVRAAREALEKAARLSPRDARAQTLNGFLSAADNRLKEALQSFDASIALDGAQGNAWLGRGLCRIRRGEVEAGKQDLLVAAALEPQRSVFRSYLGKAFALSRNPKQARKELDLARTLDSQDPTAWLYSALLALEENRINEAIADLEKSAALNENRSVFRSRLLLDQDRSVRGANLAAIYQDAGMKDVAVREATKAVESDYANYSAHLFLANSYNALRDPQQVNLRYETAWLNEYLLANLLSPVGADTLSPMVSQQEYSKLFEQNRLGLSSLTEYSSRGDWLQAAVQHGNYNGTAYAIEETYRSQNGDRPNNDMEQLTLSGRFKQQITPRDSLYFQVVYYNTDAGDLAPYYDPALANPTLRVNEKQEPLLIAGYHHEWAPGIHTLALAGRLEDTVEQTSSAFLPNTIFFAASPFGTKTSANLAAYDESYRSEQEMYVGELQQVFTVGQHTLIFGGRYQTGQFDARSDLSNGQAISIVNGQPVSGPIGTPVTAPITADFERFGVYAYEQWRPVESLLLIGGIAYDSISFPLNYRFTPLTQGEESRDLVGPKAGVVWTPTANTTVRGAYSRALGGVSFDQSFRLEPSQVAGVNQAFRSLIPEAVAGSVAAPEFDIYGLQFEQRLPRTRTYVGISAGLLQSEADRTVGAVLFQPPFGGGFPWRTTGTRQSLDYEERNLAVTLNQLLSDEFAVGVTYQVSHARLDSRFTDANVQAIPNLNAPFTLSQHEEATLHQVRLQGLFNHPSGFFCGAEALWNSQSNQGYSPDLPGDDFWQFNLYAGYRFFRRHAEFRVGLLNLTDQDYRLNPLNLTAQLPRDRTLTLSFRFSF